MNNGQVNTDNLIRFDMNSPEHKVVRDAMHNVFLVAVRGIVEVCPHLPPVQVMALCTHSLARVMCELYVADEISVSKFRKLQRDIFESTTKGLPVITPTKAKDPEASDTAIPEKKIITG